MNQVTLTGTAAAGSTVEVFDGASQIGTASANGSGAWSFATGTLADGSHAFTAKALDAAGNLSVASSALNVKVDTVAPNAPNIISDAVASGTALIVTGTAEAGSTVKLFDNTTLVGTGIASASGAWNINTGSLSGGTQNLTATATDAAGNVSNVSNALHPVIVPPQPALSEYVGVNKTTVAAGGSVTIDAYNMNLGNAVSGPSTARIYLSTDPTITTSDTVLATLTTSQTLATISQPGYYDNQAVTVTLPGNLAPGTYYIGGIANYNNQVSESSTANSTYNVVPITVTAPPQADLSEYVSVNKTTVAAGGSVIVDAYNMNLGNAVSGPSTARIYLSTDPTITTSDTVLATLTTSQTLATVSQPGYYDHQTVSVTLPGNLAPGTYYIGGIANYNNQVSESNTANNTYDVEKITVTAPPQADLSEYVGVNKTTVAAGGSVTIDAYDMNLGNGVSGPSTARIYLSTDPTITTSDTVLATLTTSQTLATVSQPGYYDHQTVSVTLPGNLAPGTYYIGGIANYNNQLSESNTTNNTYDVVQITVTAPVVAAGATLDLAGAYSGSVSFSGSTGTLALDQSSLFTGTISNLTGNGNLSSSDQIDLKDISFGSGTTVSYAGNASGGTLTVTDAQNDTANLKLAGNYTNSTFTLSSDGNGGTTVVDPPLPTDHGCTMPSQNSATEPVVSALDQKLALWTQHMASAFPSSGFGSGGSSVVSPSEWGHGHLPQLAQAVASQQHV